MCDLKKRAKRRNDDKKHIKKQKRIIKSAGLVLQEDGRYRKKHALDCGKSGCKLCGNPRKINNELTIQEKKQIESERYDG